MAFEIHIFEGDPNRGCEHDGTMFSLRMEDGSYYKSTSAFLCAADAAVAAVNKASALRMRSARKKASCQT